jgi:hypothetical protein
MTNDLARVGIVRIGQISSLEPWVSASGGITTIMRSRPRPGSACGGGKSTWAIGSFVFSTCWPRLKSNGRSRSCSREAPQLPLPCEEIGAVDIRVAIGVALHVGR